nr:EamA family transporter [Streptococcus mutans]
MNKAIEKRSSFLPSIILTTLFMGSSFPTGKYLISIEHAPPFLIGGWRFCIVGILMILWTLITQGRKSIVPVSNGCINKGIALITIIGLLQTTGTMGFLNLAMDKGPSSSMSSIILFTNPLWLAILAHFLLNDKLNYWKIVSLVLGITGMIICLGLDKSALGIGTFIALLGSFCWSVNTVITKRIPFDKGSWIFTGWQLLIGGIGMTIISAFLHESYHLTDLNTIGWWCFIWLIFSSFNWFIWTLVF